MTFSIATWNINSVRLRIDLVVRYLLEHQPDVLCLQETKCPDANFPFGAFRDAGYPHIAINGQKGYHGVAVVSRIPLATFSRRDFCAKGDARHLHVVLGGEAEGLELHNFYVPAGGDEPDPEINVKFAHKLAFVDEMVDWAAHEKPAAQRSILVGDLNIAPLAPDGAPRISQVTNLATVASVDGLLFNQDRAAVVDGRMAGPGRADEVMMNAAGARILGVRVGQTMDVGLDGLDQRHAVDDS